MRPARLFWMALFFAGNASAQTWPGIHVTACDFAQIAPGTYALAVIHDENLNGKLDANWLGIPSEGYGFSNDARAALGPPSFSAASFAYDGRSVALTIGLNY